MKRHTHDFNVPVVNNTVTCACGAQRTGLAAIAAWASAKYLYRHGSA